MRVLFVGINMIKYFSQIYMNKETGETVYTYGVFDLLHYGHLQELEKASKLGDKLIVGVFTDEVVANFKRKPIIPQEQRRALLAGLTCVSEAVLQDEFAPDKNILKIRPHIIAKGPGAGWTKDSSPCDEIAQQIGAKIVILPYHPGVSTSEIIKRIKEL